MFRLSNGLTPDSVNAVFCTTTALSPEAQAVADELRVRVERVQLASYPMIKCNINPQGERIYHLPFDQMYDRVVVGNRAGEFYVADVAEAERLGFRRAFRWRGQPD